MNTQNLESVVESEEPELEDVGLLSYWTLERMEAAQPISLPVVEESSEDLQVSVTPPEGALSRESRGSGGVTFQPRPIFSTSLIEDRTVPPYQYVGKLFMSFSDGDYVGSAYVIGESTIGTAGHCLYLKGEWATRVLFRGRYHNGLDVGRWSLRRMATLQDWVEGNAGTQTEGWAYAYDMAFGIASRPIRPTMGKLGFMAGYPVDQDPYTQIGYPADPLPDYPFYGERMWKTVGNYVSHSESGGTPKVIKAGGNMTRGCSGGPWVVFKGGHWRVNGINSHRLSRDPYHIKSPYFGQGFVNLIEWMQESGGDNSPGV